MSAPPEVPAAVDQLIRAAKAHLDAQRSQRRAGIS
jgi:hypothetical protein